MVLLIIMNIKEINDDNIELDTVEAEVENAHSAEESFNKQNYSDNVVLKPYNKNCKWYILRSFTNQEQRAVNEFTMKLRNLNKLDALVEIFTPKEQVVTIKNNKKVPKEESFYHGYIFVCIDQTEHNVADDMAHMLLSRNHQLQVVSNDEIEVIKELVLEKGEKPRTSFNIDIGHAVRVIDGPYSDMKGVVDKIDVDNNTLVVKLGIFGRETPVELSLTQVTSDE